MQSGLGSEAHGAAARSHAIVMQAYELCLMQSCGAIAGTGQFDALISACTEGGVSGGVSAHVVRQVALVGRLALVRVRADATILPG